MEARNDPKTTIATTCFALDDEAVITCDPTLRLCERWNRENARLALVKVLCAGLSLAYAAHQLESRKRQEAPKAAPEPIDRSNSACG
jgi:hypothetical protein